jgi:DNA-directed RNA polymerase
MQVIQSEVELQKQREQGFDFGQYTPDENIASALDRKLFTEAVRVCLGIQSTNDRELNLEEPYSNFKNTLKKKLLQNSKGRPAGADAVWRAFSIEKLLTDSPTKKDQEIWADVAEVFFSITLHEMLRCLLEAMSGNQADPEFEDTLSLDEWYPWPALPKVLERIWEKILLELALIGDAEKQDSTWKARLKILNATHLGDTPRRLRYKMIKDLLKEVEITNQEGTAFANELIDLVQEAFQKTTPLFEIKQIKSAKVEASSHPDKTRKPPYCLKATPALIERVQQLTNPRFPTPLHAPLIVPPRAWNRQDGNIHSGGYYYQGLSLYKFKGSNTFIEQFQQTVSESHCDEVFAALNALQNTAWRINTRVRTVIHDLLLIAQTCPDAVMESNFSRQRDNLISKILIDVTACRNPSAKPSPARFRKPGWRFLGKDFSRQSALPKGLFNETLMNDLETRDAFYFAYQADTRGRLYTKAGWLSPYGEDLAKALLEFADQKPLTAAGIIPLAIHGSQQVANAILLADLQMPASHQSLTLEERVQWIELKRDDILASASHPLEHLWWMEVAKKPFQFLAFCLAWADYLNLGENAPCALPVHQDGTCNGLQHIAAMTGSRALAEATNVVASSSGRPRDIYLEVAQEAEKGIPALKKNPQKAERQQVIDFIQTNQNLAGLLDREMAKKVVMIIPYGATQLVSTILRELKQRDAGLREQYKACHGHKTDNADYERFRKELAQVLAELLQFGLNEKYPVIKKFKSFLKTCITALQGKVQQNQRNLPLLWVAPSGFCALQRNFLIRKTEIARSRFGKKHRLTYDFVEDQIDIKGQKRGILPNLIHSFDSAHLIKTVNKAHANGLRSFSVVHDSYATHPADADTLASCIREAFIEVYSGSTLPLQHFADWCTALIQACDTPDILPSGDFTDNEKNLLKLVSAWQKAGLLNRMDETDKLPQSPCLGEFEIETVRQSRYFFS